jgi:hypothetical protein
VLKELEVKMDDELEAVLLAILDDEIVVADDDGREFVSDEPELS